MSLTSLPSEGPYTVRVCRESNLISQSTVQPATSMPLRQMTYVTNVTKEIQVNRSFATPAPNQRDPPKVCKSEK